MRRNSSTGKFEQTEHEVLRFLRHFSVGDGCWEWTLHVGETGYGIFWPTNRKPTGAHRYMWSLVHGEIPTGMLIRHTCDNRKCVNPDHLQVGTYLDNTFDRQDRKRGADNRGSKHPFAKLTEKDVLTIRNLYTQRRFSQRELGKQFGVSQITVGQIVRRERWSHLGDGQ